MTKTARHAKHGPGGPKRRRRAWSLNGLAIQLSAFALSFTLVALLVVSGSQAAFVEQNQSLLDYVPIGTPAPTEPGPRRPAGRTPAPPPAESPVPSETPAPTESAPPEENPPSLPTEEPPAPPEMPASVSLTDSAAGTAMFSGGTPLVPGVTRDRCIEVSYSGSADPLPVRLYAAGTSGQLAPYLDLTIDVGRDAPGSFGGCGGFTPTGTVYAGTLAGFAAAHDSYPTGRTAWQPTGSEETRSFRFRLSLQDVPAAAGKSVTFGFSWETRAP